MNEHDPKKAVEEEWHDDMAEEEGPSEGPIPQWLLNAGRRWQKALQEWKFHIGTCPNCRISRNESGIPITQSCGEGKRLEHIETKLRDEYHEISTKFVPEKDVPGYKEWLEEEKDREKWRGTPEDEEDPS